MSRLFLALRSLVYGAGFFLLWGWLALDFDRFFAGRVPALPAVLRLPGAVLMVVGGMIAIACVAAFVIEGRGTPAPFDAPRVLVPKGPYRWVRNPMYWGGLILLVGFGCWRSSAGAVILAAPAWLAAHLFVVFYEEPTLKRRFGLQYIAYQALVHRWRPSVPDRDLDQAVAGPPTA